MPISSPVMSCTRMGGHAPADDLAVRHVLGLSFVAFAMSH
jgi:hypothetical protein